jgi:hypothetical protein
MIPDRHPSCRGPLDLLPTFPPVSAIERRERAREGEIEKERAREGRKSVRERARARTHAHERERASERERERERSGGASKRDRTSCEGMLSPLHMRVRMLVRESACVRVCTCVFFKYSKGA